MYYTENYYKLNGTENMKRELYENGPMECGIYAT